MPDYLRIAARAKKRYNRAAMAKIAPAKQVKPRKRAAQTKVQVPTDPELDAWLHGFLEATERIRKLDLPEDDGEPMESEWHYFQIGVLIQSVYNLWHDRRDFYAGGNMFLYYDVEQAEEISALVKKGLPIRTRYKGPDFFVVTGVEATKPRRYWAVWDEGGRYPDLIVELLSPSTAHKDKHENRELYAKVFRVPEYFWYDQDTGELAGFRLDFAKLEYEPIVPDERGWLWSKVLGAYIGVWEGEVLNRRYRWLRLFDADGNLVLIDREREAIARARAEAAERRIAELEAELRRLREG
jgi:Uma2 family endonuclease